MINIININLNIHPITMDGLFKYFCFLAEIIHKVFYKKTDFHLIFIVPKIIDPFIIGFLYFK